MKIEIYTDGACSGNPGKGGYGVVMYAPEIGYRKEFSEGYRLTTNNRMELLAVITALDRIKSNDNEINIYTDSKYIEEAVNKKWIDNWMKKGFKNVKNPDLWQKFISLFREYNPKIHWIKGHNGHTENEKADELAVKASMGKELKIDHFYETQQKDLFNE